MTTPWQYYQTDLARDGFSHDPAQEHAVSLLQDLYERLVARQAVAQSPAWYRRLPLLRSCFGVVSAEPEMGLYFWGGVGRGKTYLMDTFYESLPFDNKMRAHFHRFMRRVHQELKTLPGEKNPLEIVADRIAAEACVICFDEFFVSDITDAMILATLLEALFARGVTLVATSNIIPDGLYKDGLQRTRFLPAIALLNRHTLVVNVDGGTDYRLRTLEQAELYHSPLDAEADKSLAASFENLVTEAGQVLQDTSIDIEGRSISVRRMAEDVIWFEFEALCDGPRSQNDYIDIACEYHAVLIGNIPVLGGSKDDQARRFINLVDEFYDRNVKLVLSAEVPLHELYAGGRLEFEFQRTQSRLLEMQSHEYLALAHKV